ncbi:di-trans,poly-cis-decaprenylcistransferase [Candidatus Micrarchaeota archaeon]|nr:di-trans,poly-cis-decaprenylcistransferase [Candidatus Micrarchaeota archaeon]
MAQPLSLALIPDGNRRYAQKNKLTLPQAYAKGFEKIDQLLEWIKPTEIRTTTLWALSLENLRERGKVEVQALFLLMRNQLERAVKESGNLPCIRFIGRTQLLPTSITERITELERETSGNERRLNIALAYSGREELVRAARQAAEAKERGEITEISEETFQRFLYQPEPVDLLIRTGGVQRTSGFMPWQNAYAENYFSEKLWPEFEKEDFAKALDFYGSTERRFGK